MLDAGERAFCQHPRVMCGSLTPPSTFPDSQMPCYPSCHSLHLQQRCSFSCHGNPAGDKHLRASLPHLPEVVSRATGAAGSLPGSSPGQPVPLRPVWPPDPDSQQAGGTRARAHGGATVHLWPLPLQRQAAGQSAPALQGQTRCALLQRGRDGRTRRRAYAPVIRACRQSALEQARPAAAHTAKRSHCCILLLCSSSSSSSITVRPRWMEGFVSSPPDHDPHLSETALSFIFLLLLFIFLYQTLFSWLPRPDNFFVKPPCFWSSSLRLLLF